MILRGYMENLKRNLPYLLFIGLFLKVSILGSNSFVDLGSLVLSFSLLLFFEYQFGNKQIKELKLELETFKHRLVNYEVKVDEIKSKQTAVNLHHGLRTTIK